MSTFTVIKATHLTTLDRRLITASIENNMQDVSTKFKRLSITSCGNEGNYKATLYSFTQGIGIGAKSEWRPMFIEFRLN